MKEKTNIYFGRIDKKHTTLVFDKEEHNYPGDFLRFKVLEEFLKNEDKQLPNITAFSCLFFVISFYLCVSSKTCKTIQKWESKAKMYDRKPPNCKSSILV